MTRHGNPEESPERDATRTSVETIKSVSMALARRSAVKRMSASVTSWSAVMKVLNVTQRAYVSVSRRRYAQRDVALVSIVAISLTPAKLRLSPAQISLSLSTALMVLSRAS